MFDYRIKNVHELDSPSLVLYESNLNHNIDLMLAMVNGYSERLMPHVKTNKMHKVINRMISAGIKNFKAATVAEAELSAREGAASVLIAHQLVGPKVNRFVGLIKNYPNTQFSTIIDNKNSAEILHSIASKEKIELAIYIDINNGMNRSGIKLGPDLKALLEYIKTLNYLNLQGLHVYDGHLRNPNFEERRHKVEADMQPVNNFFSSLIQESPNLKLICGGTPTFSSHSIDENRITSPGTCVLWDWGYHEKLKEQKFRFAVLLVTRVISKPTKGIITLDAGHKSIASENSIENRIKFLNLNDYELISQSEEHGVLKVSNWDQINVGDVIYGIPYHICPTINLHSYITVIRNNRAKEQWKIFRKR